MANATAELLAQLAGVAYYIITFHSYAEILESVIEQFHIENAIHSQDEAQIRKAYCFYPVARTTLCRATLVPSRSNCTNCAFFCAQSKLIIPLGGNASWRILENAIVEAVIRVLSGESIPTRKGTFVFPVRSTLDQRLVDRKYSASCQCKNATRLCGQSHCLRSNRLANATAASRHRFRLAK